jgi:hypothetical protein
MTPEETQQNIDFIIASLAKLTAAQETHDRLFQQMAKTQRQMSELLVHHPNAWTGLTECTKN